MKLPAIWGGFGGSGFAALPVKPLGLLILLIVFIFVASEAWFLWRLQQLEVETAKGNSADLQQPSPSTPEPVSLSDTPQPAKITEQKQERGPVPDDFLRESSPQNDTAPPFTEAEGDLPSRGSVVLRGGQSDGARRPSDMQPSGIPAEATRPQGFAPRDAVRAWRDGDETPRSFPSPIEVPSTATKPISFTREGSVPVQSPDLQQLRSVYADQQVDPGRWRDPAQRQASLFPSRVGKRFGRPQQDEDYDEPEARLPYDAMTADEAALLRLPDVLLAQNETSFQMQFLSEPERQQLSTQGQHADDGAYPWRSTYENMPPFPEWRAHPGQEPAIPQWPTGLTVSLPVAVNPPSAAEDYALFMDDLGYQRALPGPVGLPTRYWRERPRRQRVAPGFVGGSSERRLFTEEDEKYANQPVSAGGADVEDGREGDVSAGERERQAAAQTETRSEPRSQTPHVTYSVVGDPVLRREVRESAEKLFDFVSTLAEPPALAVPEREKGGLVGPEVLVGQDQKRSGAPGNSQPGRDSAPNSDETDKDGFVTLADLPEVLFTKPSRSLVRAVASVERTYSPSEKDRLPPFLPLHTPMEVRSLATMKKRRLVFEKVLGAGGQGIVFLARDFDNPELKVAVKVFRIRKRKNRSKGPLHEISRLQRRLRWETAILKYAPRDISSYVWSQLAHLVMPLDIVEPVDKLELSDGDMRYWHQWVLFESFAGDVAQLKQLPSGSVHARLDASKQMFMATLRLHDMGMVHSDIKLANFFISDEGRIFLGDYSLSRPIGDLSPCVEGTIRFLPPENMKCIRDRTRQIKLSSKKDTWSLGIALYKLWCHNYFPFALDTVHGQDIVARGAAIAHSELDFSHCSRSMPVAMMDLLQRMLDPDSATRPTLRELYESHVVFKEPRKTLLLHTLGDLAQG